MRSAFIYNKSLTAASYVGVSMKHVKLLLPLFFIIL